MKNTNVTVRLNKPYVMNVAKANGVPNVNQLALRSGTAGSTIQNALNGVVVPTLKLTIRILVAAGMSVEQIKDVRFGDLLQMVDEANVPPTLWL